MKTEIIYDMPELEYHASSGLGPNKWVTRSMLKAYDQDIDWFRICYIDKHPCAEFNGSPQTELGNLVDAMLEGTFKGKYVLRPDDMKMNTIAGKGFKKEHEGKIIIPKFSKTGACLDRAQLCVDQLMKVAICEYLVSKGKSQVTVRWVDEETGLRRQIRLDSVVEGKVLGDWKTTSDPLSRFNQSALRWGYDIQAADYAEGWRVATGDSLDFVFGVVQTSRPFAANSFSLPETMVEAASVRAHSAMRGIAAGVFHSAPKTTAAVLPLEAYIEHQIMTDDGTGYRKSLN